MFIIVMSLILIVLAIAIVSQDFKSRLNPYFLILIFGTLLWNDALAVKNYFPDHPVFTLFLSRSFFLGPLFSAYALIMFTGNYPNSIMGIWYKRIIMLVTLLVAGMSFFTAGVVKEVIWVDGESKTVYSYFYPYYGMAIYSFFVLIFFNAYLQLKNAYDLERPQIKTMAFISACYIGIGLTTNYVLVILGTRAFTRIGPAVVGIIIVYGLYYLLRKYQLISINKIYKQIIFSLLYFYLFYLAKDLVLSLPVSSDIVLTGWLVFGALTLMPAYSFAEKKINIFRDFFENQEANQQKINLMISNLKGVTNVSLLIQKIKLTISDIFKTEMVSLFFLSDSSFDFIHSSHKLFPKNIIESAMNSSYVFSLDFQLKKIFFENNVHVIYPIHLKESRLVILLGPKANKTLYTSNDFILLNILKDHVEQSVEIFRLLDQNKSKQSQLFQAEKTALIGQLTAGVVHEIRNPLTSMTMTLENMKEALIESGANKEMIEKLTNAGQRSAQEMKDFLKSLLDFSRKEEFVKKKFLLKSVIDETVRLINKTAKAHQVDIETHVPEGLELNADDRKIKQVLINLALNAVDAMPRGGKINIKAYQDKEGAVLIEVSDTGSGIPADKQKHLFTPFFTTKENGTGLGLTIVKEIVDLHQAQISFVSSNKGTSFKLKFN